MENLDLDQIVKDNEHMLSSIARKYFRIDHTYIGWDDIIQAGRLAIVEAVEKFNPEKNTKLSTYIYIVAKSRMHTAFSNAKYFSNYHNSTQEIKRNNTQKFTMLITDTNDIDEDGTKYSETVIDDKSLENLDKMDQDYIYAKVREAIIKKYGEELLELILHAFDDDIHAALANYDFVYQRQDILRNVLLQHSFRKKTISMKQHVYHYKHMCNYKNSFMVLFKKILLEDTQLNDLILEYTKNYTK